ncbi:hypothetical protein H6G97_06200 [Nostoc flagelliforme FACHB-838]|uniref:Uncharacterized protein n=1 Tax=Nostoc flagelliforme FACHB-838 TaxID=2692904 RepID=A0ABR8DLE6_9NOSO|nr:hypothetical protein [Nostoc flagelliforme FACHB-838]
MLYWTYEKNDNYFDVQKVSQLAQLDWSRRNSIWENNIVRKSTNSDYEVQNRPTAIVEAVKIVKIILGWI